MVSRRYWRELAIHAAVTFCWVCVAACEPSFPGWSESELCSRLEEAAVNSCEDDCVTVVCKKGSEQQTCDLELTDPTVVHLSSDALSRVADDCEATWEQHECSSDTGNDTGSDIDYAVDCSRSALR